MMKQRRRQIAIWVIGCVGTMLGGCGTDILPPEDEVVSKEPNDTFALAQKVAADEVESVLITGDLSSDDCDVYSLGSFQGGATMAIRLKSSNGLVGGESSVALFDEDQNVAYLENYISTSASFDQVFTHTVRKAGGYFLAICKTNFGSRGTVSYELEVTVGSTVPPWPDEQVVYLDFTGGGTIEIGGGTFYGLEPFSVIDLGYAPETLAGDISTLVQGDFNGLQVEFVSSYDLTPPTPPYTTVYITGSTGDYYGLADAIDWYNGNSSDNAVVFAGLSVRSGISRERFVQLVANVVSHELGHLMGLIHTDDDSELMDQATPTSLLEQDQDFSRAVLASDEFPIGYQDAMELLAFAVGLL